MKKLTILLLSLSLNLFAGNITIALSANVSYAMNDLKAEFSKLYPNANIRVILGGSGKLTAQIKNGAPYDIFMSANMKYPQALFDNNLAITKPMVYAQGSLALFSKEKIDFSGGINTVLDKNIKTIAIANPRLAPYGKYSVEALKNAKLYKKVKSKFVYAESISQTVAYSVRATDIGFIAKSALFSKNMRRYKQGINWIEINPKLYTPINQGIILLKNAKNNSDAMKFYKYILSQKAKDIFKKYGYLVK